MTKEDTFMEVIKVELGYLKESITEVNKKLDTKYVSQDEFKPIKSIVYGMVGFILLGFMSVMASVSFSRYGNNQRSASVVATNISTSGIEPTGNGDKANTGDTKLDDPLVTRYSRGSDLSVDSGIR